MPRAQIYRLKDRVLICSMQRTTAGLFITTAPYVVLPTDASQAEFGEAVVRALSVSERVVEHPKDWAARAKPRLDASGAKSESTFQRGTKLVTAIKDAAVTRLVPHHNAGTTGARKGFHELSSLAISLGIEASESQFGAALEDALNACTVG